MNAADPDAPVASVAVTVTDETTGLTRIKDLTYTNELASFDDDDLGAHDPDLTRVQARLRLRS